MPKFLKGLATLKKLSRGTVCKNDSADADCLMEISDTSQVRRVMEISVNGKYFTFVNGKYFILTLNNKNIIYHP